MKHTVSPDDILIHQKGTAHITPHKYLLQSGNTAKCIDVAILAEGYTPEEMPVFYEDAAIACESLFAHEPFRSMKKHFNIVAVASPSEDSGVSVPRLGEWKRTAFSSHFSTFYSDRYLTTSRVKSIHDALAGIPYEHIIILANTEEYGGDREGERCFRILWSPLWLHPFPATPGRAKKRMFCRLRCHWLHLA